MLSRRVWVVAFPRIQGLHELRKFSNAADSEEMIAHAATRLEHAEQKPATIGIEAVRVPGATEIIRQMLDGV